MTPDFLRWPSYRIPALELPAGSPGRRVKAHQQSTTFQLKFAFDERIVIHPPLRGADFGTPRAQQQPYEFAI
jgi:hypothetical protein